MATKRKEGFFCDTCSMSFKYRCKYNRHLECAAHQRFAESLNISEDEANHSQMVKWQFSGGIIHTINDICQVEASFESSTDNAAFAGAIFADDLTDTGTSRVCDEDDSTYNIIGCDSDTESDTSASGKCMWIINCF